jgi:hypothetical protein
MSFCSMPVIISPLLLLSVIVQSCIALSLMDWYMPYLVMWLTCSCRNGYCWWGWGLGRACRTLIQLLSARTKGGPHLLIWPSSPSLSRPWRCTWTVTLAYWITVQRRARPDFSLYFQILFLVKVCRNLILQNNTIVVDWSDGNYILLVELVEY